MHTSFMIFTDISHGRRHIEFLSKSFGRFKIIRNSVFQSSIKKTQILSSVGKMGSKTRAGPGILKLKTGFSDIT